MAKKAFSAELKKWLDRDHKKTLNSLSEVFAEKSFAIVILILMSIPALPLPTGGVTHIFELIAMLVALEMIWGREVIYLPKKWQNRELGKIITNKAIPFIMRCIRWFERFSHPRLEDMLNGRYFIKLIGFLMFLFSLAAFMAPPFSGLDTLPSLGVVIIALSLMLGDVVVFIIGLTIGVVGTSIIIALGAATLQVFKHLI